MHLNFALPLGLTPSTSMFSTVLVIWLSSLRLTCVVASASGVLLSAELTLLPLSLHFFCALQANALCPQQHSHVCLIRQDLILLFHCPAFSPICHSRYYRMLPGEAENGVGMNRSVREGKQCKAL